MGVGKGPLLPHCQAGRGPGAGSTCGGVGAPGQSTDGWAGPRVKGKQPRGKQSASPSQKMKKQRLQVRAAHRRPDHTSGVQAVSRRQEAEKTPCPASPGGPAATRQKVNAAGPEGTPPDPNLALLVPLSSSVRFSQVRAKPQPALYFTYSGVYCLSLSIKNFCNLLSTVFFFSACNSIWHLVDAQ